MIISDPEHLKKKNPKATYIAFEGVNGAGKSTQINLLIEKLNSLGINFITTREPGGTLLGVQLRKILKEWNESEKLSDRAELLLFQADRAQHAAKINYQLNTCVNIISDRCYYSTLAFQGGGSGVSEDLILKLSEIALEGTYPDLVIILDLDPTVGLKRRDEEFEEIDRFEEHEIEYHLRVREKFLELAKNRPEPCLVIDANLPAKEIFDLIFPFVHALAVNIST